MDTAFPMVLVTGYALVVAFTTLPVLAVVAVLLGTRRASRGLWLSLGNAVGLALVFALATLGVDQISWVRRFRPTGMFNLVLGVLLILVATVWWLWDRRKRARGVAPNSRFLNWMGTLGPIPCALVGFQFAFHLESLILTVAAAGQVLNLRFVPAVAVMVWYCAIAVSSVAVPSLVYAQSGERARAWLEAVRDWLQANGTPITVALLLAVGLGLTAVGLAQGL